MSICGWRDRFKIQYSKISYLPLATCCWLLAAGYLPLATCRWLLAAGYLPLARSFKPRKARKLLDEEFRVFSVFRG